MDHDLRRVAQEIARRIREVTRTDGTHVFDTGSAYFQYLTHPEEPGIHLELPSNNWRPEDMQLSDADEQVLRDLGFNDPDEDWSNWYIQTFDETEADAVAWAVVDALVTVYGVPIEDIAEGVGLPRVQYTGDPRSPFRAETQDDGVVSDPEALAHLYESYLSARRRRTVFRSPWERGTRAAFFAQVLPDDLERVADLFALVPAGPGDTRATWLRRERLGWVVDPLMQSRLQHGHRVPLVQLSRKTAAQVEPELQFPDGPAVMPEDVPGGPNAA